MVFRLAAQQEPNENALMGYKFPNWKANRINVFT